MPLPEDIIAKDVTQWLDGGYFWACDDAGVFKIARLLGVGNEAKNAKVQLLDSDQAPLLKWNQLYAYWPVCGALNIREDENKFAVFLTRLQKKQWKRTYNSYCLKLRTISDKPDHFNCGADSVCVIKAAFEPEYFTYTEARSMLENGWTSVAINPNLVVMKAPDQKMVFVDGEIVGFVTDATNVFTCVNPGLKRRLLPHFDYSVG